MIFIRTFMVSIVMAYCGTAHAETLYGIPVTLKQDVWAIFPDISLQLDTVRANDDVTIRYMIKGIKYEIAPTITWEKASSKPLVIEHDDHSFRIDVGYSRLLSRPLSPAEVVVERVDNTNATMPYNSIVTFQQDRWIGFKDFTLRYVGTRVVEPQGRVVIPMTFHQFDVNGSDGMKRVEWSSGMGEISPQKFSVGTQNFFLEMRSSMLPSDTRNYGTSLGSYEIVILTADKHKALMDALLTRLNAR